MEEEEEEGSSVYTLQKSLHHPPHTKHPFCHIFFCTVFIYLRRREEEGRGTGNGDFSKKKKKKIDKAKATREEKDSYLKKSFGKISSFFFFFAKGFISDVKVDLNHKFRSVK